MARQSINFGITPNDGTGDTLRVAMDKINDNFIELYGEISSANNLEFGENTISAINVDGNILLDTNGLGTVQVSQGLEVNTGGETSDSVFYASDASAVLKIDVTNKRIGVNKAVPTAALDVVGTASITGATTLAANATIGSSSSNNLTINSTIFGSLIPGASFNLGSGSSRWNEFYATTANITDTTVGTLAAESITATTGITGNITGRLTTSDNIRILSGAFLTLVNTDPLTESRSVNFPDRSGTLAILSGGRLSGPSVASAPVSSVGVSGDRAGDVAADANYIYYCTGNYDGSTAIWKRATLGTW